MLRSKPASRLIVSLRRAGLGLVALLVLFGSATFYHRAYAGRIFPGLSAGPVDLSGLSRELAEEKLQVAWDSFAKRGLPLVIGDERVTLKPIVASATNPDLSYELIRFSPEVAVAQAYAIGRQGSWPQQFMEPFWVLLYSRHLFPPVSVEVERVLNFVRGSLPQAEQPPVSAHLVLNKNGAFEVGPEASGRLINQGTFEHDLLQRFNDLSTEPLELKVTKVNPSLTALRLKSVIPAAQELAQDTELKFTFGEQSWRAQPAVWHSWIEAREAGSGITVGLSTTAAAPFFATLAKAVNQLAKNAQFEIKDGLVTVFQSSQLGQGLDIAATLTATETALKGKGELTVPLVVKVTQPEITTAEANDLGIAEIIGVGRSNFAGSPKNRRYNIRNGSNKLRGMLIKADEEFSLIKALGTIDASTGYLQELVIKGDKTIPEFGGGLCQIGTTMFRVALASGLPILERRSHSYRVTYYEPAGTDATIYSPKPDLRFKNDTGGTILIQARIEGDNLIYEFWGKKDGRLAEQTKPKIYNYVSPPPTKLVETEDLPVGTKKCTERAHTGADTEFTYAVTYPSGEKKEQVFKSHYVPWQEVCLIGVPKGTLQPGVPATSSSDILPSADTAGQAGNN